MECEGTQVGEVGGERGYAMFDDLRPSFVRSFVSSGKGRSVNRQKVLNFVYSSVSVTGKAPPPGFSPASRVRRTVRSLALVLHC